MSEIYVILFTLSIILASNFLSKKNQYLVDKKFTSHKSFITNNLTPITGGLTFFITCLIFLTFDNQFSKFFLLLMFIIGFLSDTNYLISPTKRFLLQVFVVIIFVYVNQSLINSVRIPLLDSLLENIFIKYFFTIFCFLVLINGANFIDGVNTLLLGYFLLLSIVCLLSIKEFNILLDTQNLKVVIIILLVLFIFNFLGKLLSGDSGAYLISLMIGYFLIDFANSSEKISPYFVACLLWYPAYESLFSIVRKKLIKKTVTASDNRHLHHLIFMYFKSKLKLNGTPLNTITGLSINLFNLLIFYGAFQNMSQTKNLIFLITICLVVYNSTYLYLNKVFK